ncbi:phosphoesterase [Geobacter luticola]|uniref:protein-tyrosine-phosphatase n=2 Tax=Geomobilimonas luticola TaxID=1114878 RepID=A0ABS5SCJ4_9BACT|nr:phosphoesterase [Geomobilimonas luticola]
MAESIEMARLLAGAGYGTVYCTPHLIKGVYGAGNDAVRSGVGELQERLKREGIPLTVLPGREYYLDEFLADCLDDPLPLGDTGLLLVELPRQVPEELVKSTLFRIRQKGFTPLIAHPERCKLLDPPPSETNQKGFLNSLINSKFKIQNSSGPQLGSKLASNSLLAYLQEIGCAFQGNLGSFAGYYGHRARASAERMREMGLYSCFGSDGHNVEGLKEILVQGTPSPGALHHPLL